MSRRINFYTISIQNQNGITDYPVNVFFESVKESILNEERNAQVVRRIGEKWIRIFPYYFSMNERQMVIPFGKLKDKNKPYWINDENRLEEIPTNLFDINSLAFDVDYNVMAFTSNREGPNIQNVQEYLNSFIPNYTGLAIVIEPIMYNTGIEKVRNASLVRSVTFSLDLGRPLNNFYIGQIADNEERTLIDSFRNLAMSAKDNGESRSLSLTLGLGRTGKKDDTLNLESMLSLLGHINIDDEFVTEIKVNYKDGTDDKIEVAKLKESNVALFYLCKCEETQVSPENLLGNINSAVADKVLIITRHVDEYFRTVINYDMERFDVVETWDNNM